MLAIFGTVVISTDFVSFILRLGVLAPTLAEFRHPMEEVGQPALGGGGRVLGLLACDISGDLSSLFSL